MTTHTAVTRFRRLLKMLGPSSCSLASSIAKSPCKWASASLSSPVPFCESALARVEICKGDDGVGK